MIPYDANWSQPMQFKELEKQQQTKPKISRRKRMIKIRVLKNEIKSKKYERPTNEEFRF